MGIEWYLVGQHEAFMLGKGDFGSMTRATVGACLRSTFGPHYLEYQARTADRIETFYQRNPEAIVEHEDTFHDRNADRGRIMSVVATRYEEGGSA